MGCIRFGGVFDLLCRRWCALRTTLCAWLVGFRCCRALSKLPPFRAYLIYSVDCIKSGPRNDKILHEAHAARPYRSHACLKESGSSRICILPLLELGLGLEVWQYCRDSCRSLQLELFLHYRPSYQFLLPSSFRFPISGPEIPAQAFRKLSFASEDGFRVR